MDFPNRLRELRLAKMLTQSQVAFCLSITERGYRNYEIGAREPKLTDLIKLADFFDVPLDYLVGRDFPQVSLVDSE